MSAPQAAAGAAPRGLPSLAAVWNWRREACLAWSLAALFAAGCRGIPSDDVWPMKHVPRTLTDYRDAEGEIAWPLIDEPVSENVANTRPPRTLRERVREDEVWDLTLMEAMQFAINNNKIIRRADRSSMQGGVARVLSNPDFVPSVYDPAIQRTGVQFGGRGVEAALAAFDAQLDASMVWGKNEIVPNNLFFGSGLGGGAAFLQDTANFEASLTKTLATGGQFAISHGVDYSWNNSPANLFPSAYNANVQAQFRQPLLQGAGVEFNSINGPIGGGNSVTGVTQGVAIARINGDISLADFEMNVTDMLFDVEKAYWDLYLAYRRFDAAVAARESAMKSWRKVQALKSVGSRGGGEGDLAQATEAYYERQAAEEAALAAIDELEVSLRRLCGLPINDGRIIRPSDEPVAAEIVPDWHMALAEALTRRVELRRQKWEIKSLDLQLIAAKNLLKPRLDFVSSYTVNALGDKLLAYDDDDEAGTAVGLNSAYGTLVQGDFTGWQLGAQFSMPLGFRAAHTQVKNYELRLAKARQVLRAQEEEIAYELAGAFQDLALSWANAETNYNRRLAAERRVRAVEIENRAGSKTLDELLRAQADLALADVAYFQSLIDYTKTIAHIHYRRGVYLEMNNVHLAEGAWHPDAYREALRRAWARTYAVETDKLAAEPHPFSSHSPVGTTSLSPPVADEPAVPPADVGAEPGGAPTDAPAGDGSAPPAPASESLDLDLGGNAAPVPPPAE